MSAFTIPMPEIITRLASKVNCGDEVAGAFLKEFTMVITQGLAADGFVRIAGLGTFKVAADVDGKPGVEFAPESSLAEKVNEPFAMFESVELADSLTDDELDAGISSTEEPAEGVEALNEMDEADGQETIAEADVIADADVTSEADAEAVVEDKPQPGSQSYATDAPTSAQKSADSCVSSAGQAQTPPPLPPRFATGRQAAAPCSESAAPSVAPVHIPAALSAHDHEHSSTVAVRLEPESRVTIKRVGHTTLTLVVTAIAACLLGLVAGYMAYSHSNFGLPANVEVMEDGIFIRNNGGSPDDAVGQTQALPGCLEDSTDMAEAVPEQPADDTAAAGMPEMAATAAPPAAEVVTDTVKPGNYLSVMARRHYGNAKFWVYIYLENKDKIKDPDNLENGMVVVIPPAAKYDIDPSSKESLKKADREAYKAISE